PGWGASERCRPAPAAVPRASARRRLVGVHGGDNPHVVDETPLTLMFAGLVETIGPEVLCVAGDVRPLRVHVWIALVGGQVCHELDDVGPNPLEIGRASCRERV